MTEDLERRIDAMLSTDRLWAWGLVIGLWLSYAFVFFAINTINTDGTIKLVLIIGGALVLMYNTASITEMIVHYKEDKNDIYGIDIKHMDEMRARKNQTTI